MRTVGVYSIKGGVGKTTTAVNLAERARARGFRTLLVDLDAQASATYFFRVRVRTKKKTLADRLLDGRMGKLIRETDHPRLDLVPADASSRYLEHLFATLKKPRRGLARVMKPVRGDYDVVIFDCPPNLSTVAEGTLTFVRHVVVPVIPTTLSVRTLEQLEAFNRGLKDPPALLVLPSMVDRRKKLHRETLVALRERAGTPVLEAEIPYASVVEQMAVKRAPLATFAPTSAAALAYDTAWNELETRLGGTA